MTVATPNTAAAAVAWARRQLGASSRKVERWNSQAPGEWCGVWLAAAMRAMGLKPPSGYPAAINWSSYGTAVKPGEEQPGDILVYGSNHVAMYTGGGQQIQGNDQNGTVGVSGTGSGLGLGPITAIRRPPYGNVPTPAERRKHERIAGEENITKKGIGGIYNVPGLKQAEEVAEGEKTPGGIVGEILSGLENLLGEKAVPIMLNVGLVGGGAFLAYFGIARMFGVAHPVQTPARAVKGVGEAAATGAA